MKRVCVIVSVGIVFAQSVFVFFNLRANSRHISQHFAALNMKEEVSREITTTEQGLRQAKHFPSSHREKIASEVLEPVAMEENLFPVQNVTAALRVTLRDMTETYVAVAWDREVPDDHAS